MSTQLERQRARSISAAPASRGFLACLCLCLGLTGVLLTTIGSAASRDTAKAKEAELRQMRERIETVRKSIQADAERRDSLAGELKQADESIQTARGQLADIRQQRLSAEQQLKELQQQQATDRLTLQMERDSLARELKLSYMNGRNEQMKLLLNQQNPAQLGRMLSYYGYFGRARAEHIQSINEQLAHLELLAERINTETERLRGIESANERSAQALAEARQKRAQTLKQVESKLKTGNEKLAKLKSDAAGVERLVDELRKAMVKAAAEALAKSKANKSNDTKDIGKAVLGPAPAGRGSWPWPVKGQLLARYGQLRAGGPLKWDGLMIASPLGAQVRAPAAGRVLYADWLPGLGLLMVLDHGGGIMSLYGHNEQLFKKVGEQVQPGEVLAAVGETGLDGQSGVYLEIRNGKQPVDPLNWLGKP